MLQYIFLAGFFLNNSYSEEVSQLLRNVDDFLIDRVSYLKMLDYFYTFLAPFTFQFSITNYQLPPDFGYGRS